MTNLEKEVSLEVMKLISIPGYRSVKAFETEEECKIFFDKVKKHMENIPEFIKTNGYTTKL